MSSKLAGHFMSGGNPQPWIEAGAKLFKFAPDALGMSSQVPPGPLVVGKLDQQDDAIGITDWKALMKGGHTPLSAAELRFNAQRNIFVGPNKPPVNRYAANPRVDVWEDDNEVAPDNQAEAVWYASYCVEMMKFYESIGKKRANFSFAVGTPEREIWEYLLPAIEHARDHGHYIALHEYMGYEADYGIGWNQVDANRKPTDDVWHGRDGFTYPWGWAALRYRYIWDTVLAWHGLENTKLIITELGCDSVESVTPAGMPVGSWKAMGLGPEEYADMLVEYDDYIRQDPYVVGAAIFTVGSVGVWSDWDIKGTVVESDILTYLVDTAGEPDVEPPPVEPPPPPPPDVPTGNLLLNPSFELGHTDAYNDAGERLPIQIPLGWEFKFDAYPNKTNPFDSAVHNRFGQPECNVLHKSKFPPTEWAQFGLDGDHIYKWFGKAHRGRLIQTVDLPASDYQVTFPVFADAVMRYENNAKVWADDDRACLVRVKVNEKEILMPGDSYDVDGEHWFPLRAGRLTNVSVKFSHPGGACKIAFHLMMPYALPQNGVFIDNTRLTAVSVAPPPPPPPPPPAEKHLAIVVMVPQDTTVEEDVAVAIEAHKNRHTVTPSIDDAMTVLNGGNVESFAKIYRPGRQEDRVARIAEAGYRWEEFMPPPPPTEPKPPPPPVEPEKSVKIIDISKHQGVIYPNRMKDAGIDGVMVRAAYGDMSANHKGTFVDERVDTFVPQLKAAGIPYGFYFYFHPGRSVTEQFDVFKAVVQKYGYQLPLALDLEETKNVDATTAARARQFLALMDETFPVPVGHDGDHLIYTSPGYWTGTLKSPAWGAEFDLWLAEWNTADLPFVPAPWPKWTLWQHTSSGDGPAHGVGSRTVDLNRFNGDRAQFKAWQRNVPPAAAKIDLLPYMRGDGRLYEVRHVNPDGTTSQERLQTQVEGDKFFQTKNGKWEELWADENFIWRGLDISPSPGTEGIERFYRQWEDLFSGARWCPRRMAVGEMWSGPLHNVQFYRRDDCSRLGENSGQAFNRTMLVAHHNTASWNGLIIPDVVELTNGKEVWWFAKNYGLCAWHSSWGGSAICEIHPPGARPDNVREKLGCSVI